MNEKTYQEVNNRKSLEAYEECERLIKKYSEGETNNMIRQNAIVVKDGLEKIIILKKQELGIDIQEENK